MSSVSGPALGVLKRFIDGANAQYRAAGLGEYQMRMERDGSVSVPDRLPRTRRSPVDPSPSGAPAQAQAGAATVEPPRSSPVAAAGPSTRSGAAPRISGIQQGGADAFKLAWAAVPGASQYGIWQDGVLLGHVPSPSFAGRVAASSSSVIQVDAVLPTGARTELTKPLRVGRDASGKLTFAAGDAAPATAPAAAAG